MPNNSDLLEDRVAVVTGARRGIGATISLTLANAGANIALWDKVMENGKIDQVAQEIKKLGRRAIYTGVDVTKKNSIIDGVKHAITEFGKIDILINCAGVWFPGKSILELEEETWDLVVDTNLKGTFLCCQAVGNEMAKQKKGCIVNIASDLGINPFAGIGSYGAAKAGIILLTRQLAIELAQYNVRVNAIAPGMIKTDMNIELRSSPEVERKIASKWLLGRIGETTDISNMALFLASDNASYITGQTFVVNGGGQIIPPLVD